MFQPVRQLTKGDISENGHYSLATVTRALRTAYSYAVNQNGGFVMRPACSCTGLGRFGSLKLCFVRLQAPTVPALSSHLREMRACNVYTSGARHSGRGRLLVGIIQRRHSGVLKSGIYPLAVCIVRCEKNHPKTLAASQPPIDFKRQLFAIIL